jgi:DNA-binding CsgD family transcriptional regulator
VAIAAIGAIGRDAEVASLDALLGDVPASLVMLGAPGIGKTTLVRHAIEQARSEGFCVLACCPSSAEAELTYAALGDVLRELPVEIVGRLPPPQRSAFDAALLIDERAAGAGGRTRLLGLGLLNALGLLGERQPVLLVLDDVQWLDQPSAAALEFALRRLGSEPVAVLACGREETAWLTRALPPGTHERLELGPLSFGATHRIVHDRLGVGLSRPVLRRLHEAAGGNPFFALELARSHLGAPDTASWEETPFPKSLQVITEARIGALPPDSVEALAVAAAAAEPTLPLLRAVLGEEGLAALGPAIAADVVEVAGERIRFAHPLFAAAVSGRLDPHTNRSIHRRLAPAVRNPEERAHHLAASTDPPDEHVAAALEAAAALVAARGAPGQAARLAERAARFTPAHDGAASRRRRLAAADLHESAGDWPRQNELILELLGELGPGPERAAVLARRYTELSEDIPRWEQALAEARGAAPLTGRLHGQLAHEHAFLGDLGRARRHVRAAVTALEGSDPASLAVALGTQIKLDTLAGEPVEDAVIRRALELERESRGRPAMNSPTKALGLRQLQCGFFEEARDNLTTFRRSCIEHGEEGLAMNALWQLSEAACGLGRLEEAERLAEEALEAADQLGDAGARGCSLLRLALAHAHLGRSDDAIAEAEESRRLALAEGNVVFALRNTTTIAFVELSRGDAHAAWQLLEPLPDEAARMGYLGAANIPALPLAAEAAALTDRLDEALALSVRLEDVGRRMNSPWALVRSARVRGLVHASAGDFTAAVAAFEDAFRAHGKISAHFEEARTILARGIAERRAKRWAEARASLELAATRFEHFGAKLWTGRAREELGRVSGRRRTEARLTATEQRVAERVAKGASNKEVAAALFVSVKAVEATLTRVYAKLGVRSRAELAHRFAGAKL